MIGALRAPGSPTAESMIIPVLMRQLIGSAGQSG